MENGGGRASRYGEWRWEYSDHAREEEDCRRLAVEDLGGQGAEEAEAGPDGDHWPGHGQEDE